MERRTKVISPCWMGQARNAGEPQEKGSLGGMGLRTILSLPAQTDEPPTLPLADKGLGWSWGVKGAPQIPAPSSVQRALDQEAGGLGSIQS